MKEVTVRQYCIAPGATEDHSVQDHINDMLKEGWNLVYSSILESKYDRDSGQDYSRVMDANVVNLKVDVTHYLVCLFERNSTAKTLFGKNK